MNKFLIITMVYFLSSLPIFARAIVAGPRGAGESNLYFAPSIFYFSGLRSRTSKEEKAYFASDVKIGYQFYPEIYLGGIYQVDQTTIENSGFALDSYNTATQTKRTSSGPSLGYITSSFHGVFSYFVSSKLNIDVKTSTTTSSYLYTGTGMQFDLGYRFSLWGMSVGPQISYKNYTYSKLDTAGAGSDTISPKLQESNFEPSLVLYYFF